MSDKINSLKKNHHQVQTGCYTSQVTRILKVHLSIRLLHLRGRDTQAGSMGTSNRDIQIMGPPSTIGNKVTDHSWVYIEFAY